MHRLPSTPAPPLTLQKIKESSQSDPPSTPQRHQRSSSSIYYAAAWGPPYKTPTPKRSAENINRSSNAASAQLDLGCHKSERENWLSDDSANSEGARRRAWTTRSSGESWLDLHGDHDETALNSTWNTIVKIQNSSHFEKYFTRSFQTCHKNHDSIDTVKIGNIKTATDTGNQQPISSKATMLEIEARSSMNNRDPLLRHTSEKLVAETPMTEVASPSWSDPVDASPHSKRRASAMSGLSSQRSKKRVIWRGKACAIALPLNDNRGTRPLLTSADVLARMEQWQDEGLDTRGFKLSNSPNNEELGGQTCRPYPDPDDVLKERDGGQFRVGVPNQAEWDAYVDHLKEEKLRALGVSLNDDGHPRFTRSPFPPPSRASSQLAGRSLSPPMPPSSAASHIPLSNGCSSSPGFHASNHSSQLGSAVSFPPQFASAQDGIHRSNNSVAYSSMDSMATAPLNLCPLRTTPPLQRSFAQSANSAHRSDRFSPPATHTLQSVEMAASAVSPLLEERSAIQLNALLDQRVHCQGSHPWFVPHQQHRRNYTETAPFDQFPATSTGASDKQEIVHPAPQGHQRNISEALQKEVDAAENALPTIQHFVQARVAAAPLDGVEDIQRSGMLSSLQKGGNGRDANDAHVHRQPSKPPAVVSQPLSCQDGGSNTRSSQAGSNKMPFLSHRSISSPWNSKEVLIPEGANGFRSHSSKCSTSRLNVEPEEFKFDPRSHFSSSNFLLSGNAFQPLSSNTVPFYGNNSSHKAILSKPTIRVGRLNADAPAFKPSTLSGTNSQFHSAAFNVDAPVFNPRRMMREHTMNQSFGVDFAGTGDKIFTNVSIDGTRKATRRGKVSKPVRQQDGEEHTEDDEDGRVRVSAARQKRARIQDKGCDEIPGCASTIPLQDEGVQLGSSEILLRHSPQVREGDKERQELLLDMSSTATTLRGDYQLLSFEDRSPMAVQTPSGIHALSSHPDPDMQPDGNQDVTSPSTGEQNDPRDTLAGDIGGADNPFVHHSTASLAALRWSDLATDKPPGLPSSTSKVPKLIDLETSSSARSPPPSNQVATRHTEPLSQQLAAVHSKVSLSPKSADENEGHSGQIRSLEEDIYTAGDAGGLKNPTPRSDCIWPGSSKSASRDYTVPSYDEIDKVMKQFEDNPDLGDERAESTPVSPRPTTGLFLNPSITIRSDAPTQSPIPNQKRHEPVQGSNEARELLDLSHLNVDMESRGFDINRVGGADIIDWNDALPVTDKGRFQSRTQFFDSHVNSLVRGILEDRLSPLERALETIQHSLAFLATRRRHSRPRTATSDGTKHSDADDEDEDTRPRNTRIYQTRSPLNQKKDPKNESVKAAVMEALLAHQLQSSSSAEVYEPALEQLLGEVRALKDSSTSCKGLGEIKTIVEEVISTHPRLRGKRVQEEHQAGASQKFQMQIDGLESMIKIANERAEEEYRARRKVEDDLAGKDRRLSLVEGEAAQYREASEEAERSLRMYYEEKESIEELEQSHSELALKNAALETTLEEYRLSHDQWRIDMEAECKHNTELKAVLRSLRREVEENSQSKQGLRAKLERLQDDMADVMERFAHDQTSWVRKEQELSANNKELKAEVQREACIRQKMELELDELDKEHKETSKFRDAHEISQRENMRLEALVAQVRQDCRTYEDSAHRFERELNHLRETAEREASSVRSTHEHNTGLLKSQHNSVCASLEDQISRLQGQLQQTRDDRDEIKANHQSHLNDHLDRYGRALHEVEETKEAALAEQLRCHEKALNDLRERHARALHNASDDKHRLEAHLMEKLALGSDNIHHLEGKVTDLEGRLEISRSAARAAAAAAVGRGASETDTPPVSESTTASMPLARGSGIPEKISRQALRESIMVLQDQLQNREQTIDTLEAELAKVDKDAPSKIKDRDTEIAWLRELLGLRIDDLEEIIHALSDTDYDREAVKGAVIRLKTNLQMEQQEKERAALGGSSVFSSISSLSALTQTPRALPMAAAAAWGNWRKARDNSLATLSDLGNVNHQTPSRSSAGPPSFLSGLLTPPRTSQKQATPTTHAPPTMRTLNGRMRTPAVRPLRAYSSQARSMSMRQAEKRPDETPSTPPLMRSSSYDQEADGRRSMITDLDDDASPVGSGVDAGSSLGEPLEALGR